MGGTALPRQLQRVVHPVVVCGAAPNLGAALLGAATGEGYWATLRRYLTRVSSRIPCRIFIGGSTATGRDTGRACGSTSPG